MTDNRQTLIAAQLDAIGLSEVARFSKFRSRGERADVASDAFWILTDAMRQSAAHLEQSYLFERPTDGDETDEQIALHLRLCKEARDDVRKLL